MIGSAIGMDYFGTATSMGGCPESVSWLLAYRSYIGRIWKNLSEPPVGGKTAIYYRPY
jgi:hypothetical protein